MNPYGVSGNIFESQASQSQNSFRDPLNMAHLYPGWGVNPNYQTPAEDAPYRPAYQGPNPYAAYQKPTFMGGISQLYSPFQSDPYWGNPVDNNRGAMDSVATKPFDAAARIAQRFIAPAVIMGVSQAMLRGAGTAMGTGLAEGLGASAGGMISKGAGLFGSYAVPFAVGLAATHAADAAVIQPYIRSRQMAETVRDSFAGVTFSSGGNSISGRGLSNSTSASMGSEIDKMGIQDRTFGANQFHGIASMGMRAGLFDDANGSGDILKRVGSIAAQIKTIVAISKDPNIQSAIEELAKLKIGGASLSGGSSSVAAQTYGALGMAASVAGTSVQRLMNTVGNQGQYMFQMNGLTPYLGQLAAGNAFSGFKSAERMGLLSTAQLARMGGAEGATQSAVAAQISASDTMYNRMGLMNQYAGKGRTSGVVNTISAFGAQAAQDPLAMAGNMLLHSDSMRSQQMKTEGSIFAEKNAIEYLKNNGTQPGPDGKYDPAHLAAIMQSQGVPPEQIRAYMAMRREETDPDALARDLKSIRAQGTEQILQTANQQDMGGGIVGIATSMYHSVKKDILTKTAIPAYFMNKLAGYTNDKGGEFWNYLLNGNTVTDKTTVGSGEDTSLIGAAAEVHNNKDIDSSLDKVLDDPKYGGLKQYLSSEKTTDGKMKKIDSMTLEWLRKNGVNATSDKSRSQVTEAVSAVTTRNSAMEDRLRRFKSEVNYKGMDKFEDSTTKFANAVNKLVDVGKDGSGKSGLERWGDLLSGRMFQKPTGKPSQ